MVLSNQLACYASELGLEQHIIVHIGLPEFLSACDVNLNDKQIAGCTTYGRYSQSVHIWISAQEELDDFDRDQIIAHELGHVWLGRLGLPFLSSDTSHMRSDIVNSIAEDPICDWRALRAGLLSTELIVREADSLLESITTRNLCKERVQCIDLHEFAVAIRILSCSAVTTKMKQGIKNHIEALSESLTVAIKAYFYQCYDILNNCLPAAHYHRLASLRKILLLHDTQINWD